MKCEKKSDLPDMSEYHLRGFSSFNATPFPFPVDFCDQSQPEERFTVERRERGAIPCLNSIS